MTDVLDIDRYTHEWDCRQLWVEKTVICVYFTVGVESWQNCACVCVSCIRREVCIRFERLSSVRYSRMSESVSSTGMAEVCEMVAIGMAAATATATATGTGTGTGTGNLDEQLMEAVSGGCLSRVQALLLQRRGPPDLLDAQGLSPLQHAAYKGDAAIVQLLIDQVCSSFTHSPIRQFTNSPIHQFINATRLALLFLLFVLSILFIVKIFDNFIQYRFL